MKIPEGKLLSLTKAIPLNTISLMSQAQEYFVFSSSDVSKTDVQLVGLQDTRTNIKVTTAINNPAIQGPSIMAFAGARYSRSSDSIEDIYREIKAAGQNAQEKLANIFRKYGHASVADMSQVFLYIENIPQILATKFFNETSLGGGQERSTRYQDFGNLEIEDLDSQFTPEQQILARQDLDFEVLNSSFKDLQKYSLAKYQFWKERLTKEYTQIYNIDPKSKKQQSSLKARVFDSARSFLLSGLGNRTSLAWVTSAREWSRLISSFKGNQSYTLQCLGQQIEELLAPTQELTEFDYLPEAPDLIRYTSADESSCNILSKLSEYLDSNPEILSGLQDSSQNACQQINIRARLIPESVPATLKVVSQLILSLHPDLDILTLLERLKSLSEGKITTLSKLVLAGFDHHKQMPNTYRVNALSYQLDFSLAEARDLNRHRAWGRYIPLLDMVKNPKDILSHGFSLPLYLTQNPKLEKSCKEFSQDLQGYYLQLEKFLDMVIDKPWFDKEIIKQILPFAHTARMFMHTSIKELSYMTMLRVRPGGHINYREIAYQIVKKAKDSNLWLTGLDLPARPNPSSREEFIDRS